MKTNEIFEHYHSQVWQYPPGPSVGGHYDNQVPSQTGNKTIISKMSNDNIYFVTNEVIFISNMHHSLAVPTCIHFWNTKR
jgi:hypothetical protein